MPPTAMVTQLNLRKSLVKLTAVHLVVVILNKCFVLFVYVTAVCQEPCLNGGMCIKPGQCSCPEGFTGTQCETGNGKQTSLKGLIKILKLGSCIAL